MEGGHLHRCRVGSNPSPSALISELKLPASIHLIAAKTSSRKLSGEKGTKESRGHRLRLLKTLRPL